MTTRISHAHEAASGSPRAAQGDGLAGVAGGREIILPWPSTALSPNSRVHWRVRAKAVSSARAVAFYVAREAGWRGDLLPPGRLHLWWDYWRPHKGNRPDDDNMLSRCKAYRDGLADALGIDDQRFVSHPFVQDAPHKGGLVRVRITGWPQ